MMLCAQPLDTNHGDLSRQYLLDRQVATILAEVYMLSNPQNDPNELVAFVEEHPDYFDEKGTITRAARDLGNWILAQDMTALAEDCLARIEQKLERDDIPKEYAEQCLKEIKKDKKNCIFIANDLIWLSNNLSKLVKGNLMEYLSSARNFDWQLLKILEVDDEIYMSDPEIPELISQDRHCYQQKIADIIHIIALISEEETEED